MISISRLPALLCKNQDNPENQTTLKLIQVRYDYLKTVPCKL